MKQYTFTNKKYQKKKYYGKKNKQKMYNRMAYKSYKALNKRELKAVDTQVPVSTPTLGSPIFFLLNGTSQGDDITERIANKIEMKSFLIRLCLLITTNDAIGSNAVRVMVVYDRQTNSSQFTIAEFIQNTSNLWSANNILNKQRFKVLYNEFFNLQRDNVNSITIEKYCNMKKTLQVFYDGASNLIGDISKGSLYLILWSDSPIVGDAPLIEGYIRTRYYDD